MHSYITKQTGKTFLPSSGPVLSGKSCPVAAIEEVIGSDARAKTTISHVRWCCSCTSAAGHLQASTWAGVFLQSCPMTQAFYVVTPSRNTQIRIRHKTRHKAKLTTETKTVTVGITQRFCQSDQRIRHVGGYSSCLLAQALYALMSLHWVPPNSRSNLQCPGLCCEA